MADTYNAITNGLSSFGSSAVQGAENLGSSALHGLEDFGSSALHGLEGLGSSFTNGIGGLFGGGAGQAAGNVGSSALNIGKSTGADLFKSAGSAIAPSATSSAASLADALPNQVSAGIGDIAQPVSSAGMTAYGATPSVAPPSNVLQKILGGASSATGHDAGIKDLASLGGLGYSLLKGNQDPKGVDALKKLASEQAGLSSTFGSEVEGNRQGMLGAGGDALVQQGLEAEQAQIRSRYAQMGMSGSSAEQQDLAAAAQRSLAQRFQLGQGLAEQGLNEVNAATGNQSALLQAILQAETQQGTDLGNALAEFAGASAWDPAWSAAAHPHG